MRSERVKNQRAGTPSASIIKVIAGKPKRGVPPWWLVLGLIAVLTFVFYGNTLNNGYSMDDELVTTTERMQHRHVEKGISAIPDIFTSRFSSDISDQTYSYRPLTTTSFAIEWDLFTKPLEQGEDVIEYHRARARVSHAINLLIYIVCCFLLYFVLLQIFGAAKWTLALLATGLFLIHPIHSEVLNNIKCRDELLCFAFGLISMRYIFKYNQNHQSKWLIFSTIFIILATLSKESGVFFVGFNLLVIYFFGNFSIKKVATSGLLLLSSWLLVILVKKTIIAEPQIRNFEYFENPLYFADLFERIPMFFYSIFWYVKMLFVPHPLKFYYGFNDIPMASFSTPEVYGGIAILGLGGWLVWRGLKSKTLPAFFTLFTFAAIIPVSNLIIPMPGIVAERFLFTASFPFIIGVVFGLNLLLEKNEKRIPKPKHMRTMLILFFCIAITSLVYTRDRNPDWDSKMSIYKADIGVLENSAKAHNLLATEYHHIAMTLKKRGDVALYPQMLSYADSAFTHFTKSAEIAPMHSATWNNLGAISFSFYFDIPNGIKAFNESVKHSDTNYNAWLNLTIAWQKSAEVLHRLQDYFPQDSLPVRSVLSPEKHIEIHQKLMESGVIKSGIMLLEAEKTGRDLASIRANQSQVSAYLKLLDYFMQRDKKYMPNAGMKEAMAKAVQRGDALYPSDEGITRVFYTIARDLNQVTGLPEAEIKPVLKSLFKTYSDSCLIAFEAGVTAKPDFFPLYEIAGKVILLDNDIEKFFSIQRRQLQVPKADKAKVYTQIGNGHHTLNQRDSAAWYYNQGMIFLQQTYQQQKNAGEEQDAQRILMEMQQLQKMTKSLGY